MRWGVTDLARQAAVTVIAFSTLTPPQLVDYKPDRPGPGLPDAEAGQGPADEPPAGGCDSHDDRADGLGCRSTRQVPPCEGGKNQGGGDGRADPISHVAADVRLFKARKRYVAGPFEEGRGLAGNKRLGGVPGDSRVWIIPADRDFR